MFSIKLQDDMTFVIISSIHTQLTLVSFVPSFVTQVICYEAQTILVNVPHFSHKSCSFGLLFLSSS